MNGLMRHLAAALLFCLAAGPVWAQPQVYFDAAYAQRDVNASDDRKLVRAVVMVREASEMMSFGVRLEFDEAKMRLVEFHKNDVLWPAGSQSGMRVDGLHLYGGASAAVNGTAELGWAVFEVMDSGASPLSADIALRLARDKTTEPAFDHFVNAQAAVLDDMVDMSASDSTLQVCVVDSGGAGVCEGDVNGDGIVNYYEYSQLMAAYGTVAGDAAYTVKADFNGDGAINYADYLLLIEDYGKADCPVCE